MAIQVEFTPRNPPIELAGDILRLISSIPAEICAGHDQAAANRQDRSKHLI
ncbi:hypothetical protein EKH55_2261 [Sinorhizobium alkalisoli]|nr:hypothetical protein EKH55_2261 [Sinorhizobium alkalisoli]